MTIHDTDFNGFGHAGSCREHASPRSDETSSPKAWIRGDTKIGPVLEVKITYQLYQYGIEMRVNTMKNDGYQSWTVISRGMNKNVDEETRCDKKEGTINSTMTYILDDGCVNRSTEVKRHSCRRLHRQGILVMKCLEHNDPNTATLRFSSRRWWSNGLGYIVTYVMSRLR